MVEQEGIIFLDASGKIAAWNGRVEEILRITAAQLLQANDLRDWQFVSEGV